MAKKRDANLPDPGSDKENSAKGTETTAKKAVWTDTDDEIMVRILKEEKRNGNQSDNGWKKSVWNTVLKALQLESHSKGSPKTADKCGDHWMNLKGNYVQVKKLRDLSGFGWDDTRKLVVVNSDVADAYLAAHPKAKRWIKTPFPLYDDVAELVDGKVATGVGAFHPGQDLAPSEQSDDMDTPNDEESAELSFNSAGDDEPRQLEDSPAPGTPKKKTRKRNDSSPSPPSFSLPSSTFPSAKRRKTSGRNQSSAHAILDVADAMRSMAQAVGTSNGAGSMPIMSPERRKAAIKLLDDDAELSDNEQVQVIRLFTRNIAVADSYLAIEKKNRRTLYLRSELDEI